jgi:drug/metabolite transporter (DMT)-like permease
LKEIIPANIPTFVSHSEMQPSSQSTPKQLQMAWVCFAGVCFLWGTTYLGIRVGVETFPPLFFSLIRLVIAGLLFLTAFVIKNSLRAVPIKLIAGHALAGGLLFSLGNGLVTVAEVHISSSLAAIISSLIPVWIVLLNLVLNRSELPNAGVVAGTLLGVAGIVIIFGGQVGFDHAEVLTGSILMFIAGLGWAGGSILIKKLKPELAVTGAAAFQMLGGGLILLPFSLLSEDWSAIDPNARSLMALAYLISFGSILAYICFLYAMRHLSVTVVSMYAYINPIVAMILGWLLLAEPLSPKILVGVIVTLSGVLLVNNNFIRKD